MKKESKRTKPKKQQDTQADRQDKTEQQDKQIRVGPQSQLEVRDKEQRKEVGSKKKKLASQNACRQRPDLPERKQCEERNPFESSTNAKLGSALTVRKRTYLNGYGRKTWHLRLYL